MQPAAILLLLLVSLAGCAGVLPSRDPRTAQEHQQRAEELIFAKDYPGAAAELAQASRKKPREGALYLRRGELLETLGEAGEARAAYEKGRCALRDDDPLMAELTYRLALLYAAKLQDLKKAKRLLADLPEGSVTHTDLQAAIALGEGRGRETLILLNEALQQGTTKDMAARILYHAAQAYHLLGDQENTFGSLYQAINLADNLGLIKDIETFWHELKGTVPPSK